MVFIDLVQAITALKKGAYLLKYGRRGKPKFCPFRLSNVSFVDFVSFLFCVRIFFLGGGELLTFLFLLSERLFLSL